MTNSTALVFAKDSSQKSQLVESLKATGLFRQIQPVTSISAIFQHLKTKQADILCWVMEKTDCRHEWINRLQAHDEWHDLPLIAFAEDHQSLIDSFQHGASDALSLQIDSQELSARIRCHLQRWNRLLELRKTQEELQRMALTDPLTGLGNRATFDMSIKQIAASARRSRSDYSLMLIDLDHFKKINDSYGHQSGDIVLKQVANAIAEAAREADICCRYGGEEFTVILPDTSPENAEILAHRIHQHIAKLALRQTGILKPVTVSIGISGSDQSRVPPSRLVREADKALYRAKGNGRNRTELSHRSTPSPDRSIHHPYPQMATAPFA
jgi:two-component system cell cycle response regulator